MNTRRDRHRGALMGLAVGDALGTTLEFRDRGSLTPIVDIIGGGPFGLEPGQWTDDTSMALCLAESLITRNGFDAQDQMERYLMWWREGHLSSTGRCFDIGGTVRSALNRFVRTGQPYAGSTDPSTAGNGSLMRLAPVVLAYSRHPETLDRMAADSSRTTHGAPQAVDACRYFACLLHGALNGVSKLQLLDSLFESAPGLWAESPLHPAVEAIARGSWRQKSEEEIRATGYVVHTLEAALWAFATTDSFRQGALRAVNLGEDADTTGAVYGQIAGAFYGVESIPLQWRQMLAMRPLIEQMADGLLEMADMG